MRLKLICLAATIVQHTPPHWFMGYRWSEWAAIATFFGIIAGFLVWLVKVALINPQNTINREQAKAAAQSNNALRKSIDMLTKKVEGIGDNATQVHTEHDRRLDDHETRIKLNEHDIAEIKEQIK